MIKICFVFNPAGQYKNKKIVIYKYDWCVLGGFYFVILYYLDFVTLKFKYWNVTNLLHLWKDCLDIYMGFNILLMYIQIALELENN